MTVSTHARRPLSAGALGPLPRAVVGYTMAEADVLSANEPRLPSRMKDGQKMEEDGGTPRPSGAPRPNISVDVQRPRGDAARTYDRLSRVYDFTEGFFERGHQDLGLLALAAQPGEHILEIGYGTGRCLAAIARSVGPNGRVAGVDISEGMHHVATRRLRRLGMADRADVRVEDALDLPFQNESFDAVFTSFCLELFSTKDIPVLLRECRRVLRRGGRMVVVSLASTEHPGFIARSYLWAHLHFPRLVDCRPIPVESFLEEAEFGPIDSVAKPLLGLPVVVVKAWLPNGK
jgi:ubiquinone/menaquinone biosynthesis C-methylase UbiE